MLWWLPALAAAAVAGIMLDTFLDSPNTTMPHEAAYLICGWIIFGGFGYIVLVLGIRGAIYVGKRLMSGERRGFPVITTNASSQNAG
jgi:hypothetical protein